MDVTSASDEGYSEGRRAHQGAADEHAAAPAGTAMGRDPWLSPADAFASIYGAPTTAAGRAHRSGWLAGWGECREAWTEAQHA